MNEAERAVELTARLIELAPIKPEWEAALRELEVLVGRAQNAETRVDDSLDEESWRRLDELVRTSRYFSVRVGATRARAKLARPVRNVKGSIVTQQASSPVASSTGPDGEVRSSMPERRVRSVKR